MKSDKHVYIHDICTRHDDTTSDRCKKHMMYLLWLLNVMPFVTTNEKRVWYNGSKNNKSETHEDKMH